MWMPWKPDQVKAFGDGMLRRCKGKAAKTVLTIMFGLAAAMALGMLLGLGLACAAGGAVLATSVAAIAVKVATMADEERRRAASNTSPSIVSPVAETGAAPAPVPALSAAPDLSQDFHNGTANRLAVRTLTLKNARAQQHIPGSAA